MAVHNDVWDYIPNRDDFCNAVPSTAAWVGRSSHTSGLALALIFSEEVRLSGEVLLAVNFGFCRVGNFMHITFT